MGDQRSKVVESKLLTTSLSHPEVGGNSYRRKYVICLCSAFGFVAQGVTKLGEEKLSMSDVIMYLGNYFRDREIRVICAGLSGGFCSAQYEN